MMVRSDETLESKYAKDCKQRPNETQHELARLAIGELGEYDSDNESINELGFFAMEHIGGDELQGEEIIVEETKNEPYGPEIIDCHDGPGESELVQNDATTNSFQQFFGKGVTSAADSAKKLGEQLRIRKGLYSRYLWRRIRANKVSGCT
mmetsp:Transcript_21584/g.48810  ORF Transcript_21584/g.48810 Transcript_21584/m.48810 type:complete len:150 (+) Transcript_21584:575-1024(+)